MRYLAVLLLSVPLQLVLIYYRTFIQECIYQVTNRVSMKMNESVGSTDLKDQGKTDVVPPPIKHVVKVKRPEHLWFRVGEVVWNPKIGYTGIIIGWSINKDKSTEPIYEVLVNHPEIPDYKTESSQNELYLLQYTQVYHPELAKYFDWYDGESQYIPKPWLRTRYPLD